MKLVICQLDLNKVIKLLCVSERERERESVCVCVCVSVRERESTMILDINGETFPQ